MPAIPGGRPVRWQDAGGAGGTGNSEKGQFDSPDDSRHEADKMESTGNNESLLTERGSSIGYNNLVVDMRGLTIMREFGWPVIFDATHSVQLPGGASSTSSGEPKFIAPLSRAAVAAGVDGVFVEVHEAPDRALSDALNPVRPELMPQVLVKRQALTSLYSPVALQPR